MNLEDFVSESLVQITNGVVKAQKQLNETTALVNPLMRQIGKEHSMGVAEERGGEPVTLVEFDVAVTATEGKETKGGIAVLAGAFSLGSQGRSERADGSESHIKFRIPLLLPVHKHPFQK